MIPEARRAVYTARIAWHICEAVFKIGVLFPLWRPERQDREVARWSTKALGLFGISIATGGRKSAAPGARLFVANHTSWLDVLALQAHIAADFVAKDDVRSWPAFGWIAHQLGTVFVSRRRGAKIGSPLDAITERLRQGRSVCLFPEGTTTKGNELLPFHAGMFEAAIEAEVTLQPVAIRYVHHDGRLALETAFTGDMTLVQSFRNLFQMNRDVRVEVTFLPEIPSMTTSRRQLARQAEDAIRAGLGLASSLGDETACVERQLAAVE